MEAQDNAGGHSGGQMKTLTWRGEPEQVSPRMVQSPRSSCPGQRGLSG